MYTKDLPVSLTVLYIDIDFMWQFALIWKKDKKVCNLHLIIAHAWQVGSHFCLKHLNYPLVLCVGSRQAVFIHLENEARAHQLQSAIFHEAVLSCLPLPNGADKVSTISVLSKSCFFYLFVLICIAERTPTLSDQSLLNEGTIKKAVSHIPLLSRPTERKCC